MTFVVGGQTFGIETRSLGTETRNLEIQDGEDVDVLRRPDLTFKVNLCFLIESLRLGFYTTYMCYDLWRSLLELYNVRAQNRIRGAQFGSLGMIV